MSGLEPKNADGSRANGSRAKSAKAPAAAGGSGVTQSPERSGAAAAGQTHDGGRSPTARAIQLSAIRKSVAFTQIVSLMMRAPLHKQHTLADLEWMLLPAFQRDQFKIAEAKADNLNVPAGFVLWASVSPEVDQRLSESLEAPLRLKPDEWNSGTILWLVEAVGDPRAIKELLKTCRDTLPGGKEAKLRTASREGVVTLTTLGALNLEDQSKGLAE